MKNLMTEMTEVFVWGQYGGWINGPYWSKGEVILIVSASILSFCTDAFPAIISHSQSLQKQC